MFMRSEASINRPSNQKNMEVQENVEPNELALILKSIEEGEFEFESLKNIPTEYYK